jgi:hypothetical protein
MTLLLTKAALIWVTIALAETVHGILRVKFLNRRVGDRRARQLGVASGSVLILAIGWLAVPWIAPRSTQECLAVGALWLLLMLSFDLGLGRFYMRMPWKRVLADFDLRNGGFLGLGMLVLFFTPLLIATLRGLL